MIAKNQIRFIGILIGTLVLNLTSAQCPETASCLYHSESYPNVTTLDIHEELGPWPWDWPWQTNEIFSFQFEDNEGLSIETVTQGGETIVEGQTNFIFLDLPCNMGVPPSFGVILPTGETCVYEYGQLCQGCEMPGSVSCEATLEECESILTDYITRTINYQGCEHWLGKCGPGSKIYRSGPVGIGSDNPSYPFNQYKLAVDGYIITEELKITMCEYGDWCQWCDYVFEPDYDLRPLGEVKAFVQQNKHLPNMPSEKEIANSGGYEVRDLLFAQQEKIEELFLYLIQLNCRLDSVLIRYDSSYVLKDSVTKKSLDAFLLYKDQWKEDYAFASRRFEIPEIPPLPKPVLIGRPTANCEFTEECSQELTQFILNLPGTGCQKWDGETIQETCNPYSNITRYGKVGIGTCEIPYSFGLAVNGGIIAEGIKVQLCANLNWCDYVFEPDYPLIPISEVDAFVKKEGHLPGSPSFEELKAEKGLKVKEIMLDHQEKLEEIFLYLLDLKERIDKKRARIVQLSNPAEEN